MKYSIFCILLLQIVSAQQPILFYQAFNTSDFTTSQGWTIQNNKQGDVYSECGGIRLLGGYDKFGKKASVMIMLKLPPHYQIKVKVQFWRLDTWDNEFFYIYIDQDEKYKNSFTYTGSNKCGWNLYGDEEVDIEFIQPHTSSSIFIFITTSLDQAANDESWGIRDFQLFLYLCPPGCLTCEENDEIRDCIPWLLLNSAFLSLTQSSFSDDGWLTDHQQSQISSCGEIPVLGGYPITGQNSIITKTFNLLGNYVLKIQFKIVFIDSWDPSEYFYLDINNQRIKQFQKLGSRSYICGNPSDSDEIQNVQFYYTNSEQQLSFKISTTLNEATNNEQFGIIDFLIYQYGEICGNKIVERFEQCDDGNYLPFDGCYNCQYSCVEGCSDCVKGRCLNCKDGWIFNQILYQCNPLKNDGIIQYFEECDREINNIKCKQNRFLCPQNCQKCEFGKCSICRYNYVLVDNICLLTTFLFVDGNYFTPIIKFEMNNYYDMRGEKYKLKFLDQCIFNEQQSVHETCITNYLKQKMLNHRLLSINKDYELNDNSQYQVLIHIEQANQNNRYEVKDFFKQVQIYQSLDIENNQINMIDFQTILGSILYSCNEQCLQCLNGQCLQCNEQYLLIYNKCTKCGDGILDIENEQCDDTNNNHLDGCYNCKIESNYYCEHYNLQFKFCERCQDVNCLSCFKVNTYYKSYCQLCKQGYYADQNGTCIQCNKICLECVRNSKNCIKFNYDYYQIKKCDGKQGLYYNFKLRDCDSQCGDSIISKLEQCDDSNFNIYDGCDNLCQIEKGYIYEKNNKILLKELDIKVYNIQKNNSEFTLYSDYYQEAINCSTITLEIYQFQSNEFNYTTIDQIQNCLIYVNYMKQINPFNLMYFSVQYKNNYVISNYYEKKDIVIIPNKIILIMNNKYNKAKQLLMFLNHFNNILYIQYLLQYYLVVLNLFGQFQTL